MKQKIIKISVIIPAFNEEKAISQVIDQLKNNFNARLLPYEIIVVNDASTDGTVEILKKIEDIKIIHHPYNKGYGASLKTGADYAQYEWLLFFDSDGQHRAEDIDKFIENSDNFDMIVGARQGYQGPILRQPGKKLLHWIANYLSEHKIPDLNSGFRLVKKSIFIKYRHILPDGFSLSTTSTIAFFKEGYNIKYVPICINKRIGKSSLKLSDGLGTLMLTLRLIMLFSPLKIFLPISLAGFIISMGWAVYDLITNHFQSISKTSGFIFVATLLIFLFGLLADQIAAIRREIKK